MRKKLFIPIILSLIILSGCSTPEWFLNIISDRTDTSVDSDAETIVNEANYAADMLRNELASNDEVIVTFAKNSNIEISYSRSDLFSGDDIVSEGCSAIFKQGDNIYARINKTINDGNYRFSEFVIHAVDDESRTEIFSTSENDGIIWTVPIDSEYKEYCVVPTGRSCYESLSFSTKCKYENGSTLPLTTSECCWKLNGTKCDSNGTKEISPFLDYSIIFTYNENKYFFVSSSPERYGDGELNGKVTFYNKKQEPSESRDYSVTLQEYIELSVKTLTKRSVVVTKKNDIPTANVEKKIEGNTVWNYSDKLKFNDTLIIETDKEWKELGDCKYIKVRSYEPASNNDCYTYKVEITPPSDKYFEFDPSKYKYENGTIKFKVKGENTIITEPRKLEPGQIIVAEPIASEGWYFPEDMKEITVSYNDMTTESIIRNLQFEQNKIASVTLLQPQYGGKINYYIDGVLQTGKYIKVRYGTKIEMEFIADNLWQCTVASAEYLVTNDSNQQTNVNGQPVGSVFVEDSNYIPQLILVLAQSTEKHSFSVKSTNVNKTGLSYDGILSIDKTIDLGKTETSERIRLQSENHTFIDNKVLKVTVTKKGEKGNDVEIYYMDRNNYVDIPVYVYKQSGYGQTRYTSIEIKIILTEKKYFDKRVISNGAITVTYTDTLSKSTLKSNEVLDYDRKIKLEISPNVLYFVTGYNNDDAYFEEMDYRKYESVIDKLLAEHQTKQKYSIKLIDSDEYGVFSYTLDGKAISGKAVVKDGQKLAVTYLTYTNYKINNPDVLDVLNSDKKKYIEKTVDDSFRNINETSRDFFGIDVIAR